MTMAGDTGALREEERASPIAPEEFARMVRGASEDQLEEGMAANGELILEEIFRQMEGRLRPEAAGDLDGVIEWRILDPGQSMQYRWQLLVQGGTCRAIRGGRRSPRVSFTVGAVDFIRLVTGNVTGPRLFVFGRLKIEGDLLLSARVPGLFSVPSP
jgi:hypothetical protein